MRWLWLMLLYEQSKDGGAQRSQHGTLTFWWRGDLGDNRKWRWESCRREDLTTYLTTLSYLAASRVPESGVVADLGGKLIPILPPPGFARRFEASAVFRGSKGIQIDTSSHPVYLCVQ
jgi:hypothetical protein